jgi:hypothetical protein
MTRHRNTTAVSISVLLALALASCTSGTPVAVSTPNDVTTTDAATSDATTPTPAPTFTTQAPVASPFDPRYDPSRASRSRVKPASRPVTTSPPVRLQHVTCWNGTVVVEHPDRRDCPPRPTPKKAVHVVARPHAVPAPSGRWAMWNALVRCEAPDRGWRYGAPGVGADAGYGQYEGGPNFLNSTWLRYGGGAYAQHAYDASAGEQIVVAERVLVAEGVGAWPVCGPRVGLHR